MINPNSLNSTIRRFHPWSPENNPSIHFKLKCIQATSGDTWPKTSSKRSSSWLPPFSANSNNSGNKLSSVAVGAVGISATRRGSREGRDHDHGSTVGVHSNKPKHTTRAKGRRGCAMVMAGNGNCLVLSKIWWSKSGCWQLVDVRMIPRVIESLKWLLHYCDGLLLLTHFSIQYKRLNCHNPILRCGVTSITCSIIKSKS